jgi:hypothetical protein
MRLLALLKELRYKTSWLSVKMFWEKLWITRRRNEGKCRVGDIQNQWYSSEHCNFGRQTRDPPKVCRQYFSTIKMKLKFRKWKRKNVEEWKVVHLLDVIFINTNSIDRGAQNTRHFCLNNQIHTWIIYTTCLTLFSHNDPSFGRKQFFLTSLKVSDFLFPICPSVRAMITPAVRCPGENENVFHTMHYYMFRTQNK